MYGDPGSSFLVTVTQRATAQPSPKNETNIIRFSNADLCNQGTDNLTAEYKVLYSNYETCLVWKLLSTEEKRCELWVKEGFEVHFENKPDEEDRDDEEDKVDGEDNVESRIQRLGKGGLGHCVQTYTENCGSMQYKIYEKEMCSLSSLAKGGKRTNQVLKSGLSTTPCFSLISLSFHAGILSNKDATIKVEEMK
uniref:Uncharacterized protein n=1 Tax=Ixodes ricinus TaxID=34613 RepID=V5H9Z5_IXORI